MIIDCISFFNELDLLEIRLGELYEICDHFIITESKETHSGKPKDLIFPDHKERFSPFKDKIAYVTTDQLPGNNCWDKDAYQQNIAFYMLPVVNDAANIIITSDLDEIPRADALKEAIDKLKATNTPQMLYIDLFFYYVNNKCVTDPLWPGPALSYRFQFDWNIRKIKGNREKFPNQFGVFRETLDANKDKYFNSHGGWHYAYMGGIEQIQKKLKAFCHSFEFDTPEINNAENIEKKIREGKCILPDAREFQLIDVGPNNCPKYLWENRERFSHLFLK